MLLLLELVVFMFLLLVIQMILKHTMLPSAGIITTPTTSLEPSGNIYLCEGDQVTLQCNVSSGSISWMWFVNSTEVVVIYTILDGNTTRTDGSITTQYFGYGSSTLSFQYRASHLIPSVISCNINHLVNIFSKGNTTSPSYSYKHNLVKQVKVVLCGCYVLSGLV